MHDKAKLAWHFLRDDGRCGYSKARPKPGGTEKVSTRRKPLALCEWGLHASENIIDALVYAGGALLRRVELGGEILDGGDKYCAAERRELWRMDISRVLHEFACWCAERALKRERKAGYEPDPRSWNVIKVKRLWLNGKAAKVELAAARETAWEAAADAAWSAARSAAWEAAKTTAWAAARINGLAAAMIDAGDIAAWAAERKAQDRKLLSMVMRAAKERGLC